MIKPLIAALFTGAVLLTHVFSVSASSPNSNIDHRTYSGQFPVEKSEQISYSNNVPPMKTATGPDALFIDFRDRVITGDSEKITGFYSRAVGGFYVIQQPSGKDGIVSPVEGVLTQFGRTAANGVIGLMAHNYSSGKWFSSFSPGDEFFVVYGDGSYEVFRYTESIRYRALDGKNALTDFIDLSSGQRFDVDQVYDRVYGGKPHLTLQTCIQSENDLTWGRMFIIAEKIR